MADPGSVGTAVPGWREAVVLSTTRGHLAYRGGWGLDLGAAWAALRRGVVEELTSHAEEVRKRWSYPRIGHHVKAAVQRSILAVRPARILAVHRHPLYGSENRLWDLGVDAVGEEWRLAQSDAFGLAGGLFKETCKAALELCNLAVGEPRSLLDDRQRRVVCHARELGNLVDHWP